MRRERYSIGEISKLCCIPISKLRYYDELGVISPCYVDQGTGYRYYDDEALMSISILRYYQRCGFRLKEIKNLLIRGSLDYLEPIFDQRIEQLDNQIAYLSIQKDSLIAWRNLIYEQRKITAKEDISVTLRRYVPTMMCHSVSHNLKYSNYRDLIANTDMCNCIKKDHVAGTTGPLYLYFPNSQMHNFADSSIYIRPHSKGVPYVDLDSIGGFCALCAYHIGSFEECEEAYDRIYVYAETHNIALRGDSFERSVIDWWSTSKEEEFLMEVIMPTKYSDVHYEGEMCIL